MLFTSLMTFSEVIPMESLTYDIEGAGVGAQGTYLVKVTLVSKSSKANYDDMSRCAVHGVLFRGFSSKEFRQNQRPLAGSALVKQQHADFFRDFFDVSNGYKNYVSMVDGTTSVMRSGKQYRVSVVMSVAKEQLHKDLESAGVIKGLNTGF